jgi:excinuclease UvrABC nuclease subunit
VSDTLLGNPQEVIGLLTVKMQNHSEAKRYEDAAFIRDRIINLETALERQKQAQELCNVGDLTFEHQGIVYEVTHGILRNTRRENQLFAPMKNSGIAVEHLITPQDSALIHDTLVRTDALNEVMCISRFVRKNEIAIP